MCGHPPGTRCAADTSAKCARAVATYQGAYQDGPALNPVSRAEVSNGGLFGRRKAKALAARAATAEAERLAREAARTAAQQARYAALLRQEEREKAAAARGGVTVSARVHEQLWRSELVPAR